MDTSSLTRREVGEWSAFVSELPAPCPTVSVSVKECVAQRLSCGACVPAARFLVSQIRRGKVAEQVDAAYRARFGPLPDAAIEVGDSPVKGPADAPVTIVEWADFECSACGQAAPMIEAARKAHAEAVRVVFKHYPLASHPHAVFAARAGVAAHRQGKFWQLHDLMFSTQEDLTEHRLKELAVEAGLDLTRYLADVADETTMALVKREMREADARGLAGTPMIFINNRHLDFDHFSLAEDLNEWIELELEAAGARP